MTRPDLTLAREFEASLAWWRAAGVDCDFTDDATAWLSDAPLESAAAARALPASAARTPNAGPSEHGDTAPRPAAFATPPAAPETPRRNLLGDSPPGDLAAFRQWWLADEHLAAGQAYPRIAPRGDAGAALMVLVPQPEEADRERLLAAILAAMGLDDGAVYIAAALPCHTPLADLGGIAASGMDRVTTHHIGLARPARLLVLGTGLGPMLGAPPDQPLREINHTGGKLPVLVSETLEALMEMPRLKARFWRRWMEWSASH